MDRISSHGTDITCTSTAIDTDTRTWHMYGMIVNSGRYSISNDVLGPTKARMWKESARTVWEERLRDCKLNYFMIPFIFTPHKCDGHKADQDNRALYSAVFRKSVGINYYTIIICAGWHGNDASKWKKMDNNTILITGIQFFSPLRKKLQWEQR